MTVLLALAVGFLAVRFVASIAPDMLRAPALRRRNHRGHDLPTAGGLLAVVAVVLVEALRLVVGAFGIGSRPDESGPRAVVVVAVAGFALLGLVDDVLGKGEHGGVRGHVSRAWQAHRLTTGLVKLLGGGALAIVLVAPRDADSGARLVADAVLVALAANLANLFDRAPGRMLKVSTSAAIPLLVMAVAASRGSDARAAGVALAVVVGAFVGLARDDLPERALSRCSRCVATRGAALLSTRATRGAVRPTGRRPAGPGRDRSPH